MSSTDTTTLRVETITADPAAFAVTSTAVYGERDAILIDAQFALPEAQRVAEAVAASGKRLTTIYVTHFHPDHYFGLPAILAAHPGARVVARPEAVEQIEASWRDKVAQWKPLVGDLIPDEPVIPQPLDAPLELEGEPLEIVLAGQGDTDGNSAVHIPGADTLVTGDFVYNGTHVWLAESTPEQWEAWLANVDRLEAIGAGRVVPGHRAADAPFDASAFESTRSYIRDFAAAVERSSSKAELIARVNERHGNRELPVVLDISASALFPEA